MEVDRICKAWSFGNELEAILTFPINRIKFRKCLNMCIARYGGVVEDIEVLDITVEDATGNRKPPTRYTISGKTDIAAYCKTNKLAAKSAQTKKLLSQHIDAEFGFKVKLSDEQPATIPSNLSVLVAQSVKFFRLKKRYSVNTGTGFRIDFTIVKIARAKTLASAALHQEKEHFEIEVEYVGTAGAADPDSLLNVVKYVLSCVKGEVHLCGASEKSRAMDYYMGLVGTRTFAGPKPVTLELQHLLPIHLEPGIPSITAGYSITDKADGESALLFFVQGGEGYLINRRLEIKGTGLKSVAAAGSILDCEVIQLANGDNLIMTFDCYFHKGTGVFEQDLITRLKHMNAVVASIASQANIPSSPYKVRSKEFVFAANAGADGKTIFELAKQMLRKNHEYNTDGLIFTPIHLGVHQTQVLPPSIGDRTWTHVFKWKPPKDNTIDFLVKVDATAANENATRSYHLYVGANCHTIQTYFESKKGAGYIPVLFKPEGGPEGGRMHVLLDGNGVAKCKSGEEILDEYVVEVAYDATTKAWVPLRIRYDKIEEARAANKITANALTTANSIWYTIMHPVTERHITGVTPVHLDDIPPKFQTDDAYYNGDDVVNRAQQKMFSMAEFHNYWVKNQSLLKKFKGHATSLFDVSCGRAGDMNKWVENNFTTVVGVDISAAGIFDKKGAYARLGNIKEIKIPEYKYVFIPLDSGKPWLDQIEKFEDDYLKKVARVTWGLDPSPTTAIKHLEGIAAKPTFEVVSCQFSLHYFFESEEKFDHLMNNINSVLAPGGHFIFTCFGGENVIKFLGDKEERQGEIDGKMVWGVRKEFKGAFKNGFGQKINVFVEQINKWHEEYLVPFDLLKTKLDKHGLRLMTVAESKAQGFDGVSHGSFESLFNAMSDAANAAPAPDANKHVKNALRMTQQEKEFSFLNNWYVFVKKHQKKSRVK